MKTLLDLEIRRLINYAKLTLKSPKRLVPALLFVPYFLWWVLAFGTSAHRMPADMPNVFPFARPDMEWAVLYVIVLAVSLYLLYRSFTESMVVYGLAEIDFLLATPIRRPAIMFFKLLKLYIFVAVYAAFLLFVISPMLGFFAGSFAKVADIIIGWVAVVVYAALLINICTTINLIATFRAGSNWWVAIAVRAVVLAVVVFAGVGFIGSYLNSGNAVESLVHAFTHPLFTILVLPAKWVVDLILCSSLDRQTGTGFEMAALCCLSGLSLAVVLSRRENPCEPSLSISTRFATRRKAFLSGGFGKVATEAWKSKGRGEGVRTEVKPFGRGATAVFWKNLNVAIRTSRSALLGVLVLVFAGLLIPYILELNVDMDVVEVVVPAMLGYFVLMYSMIMLHGFRADIRQANVLKPMPIPAWQLMLAETAHGTLLVSLGAWFAIGIAAVLYDIPPKSAVVLSAIVLPFILHASLSLQLVSAVLYPDWGEKFQQFMGGILSFIAVGLALGLPAIIVSVLWLLHIGIAIIVPIIVLIFLALSAGGISLGAYAYRRHDPTHE